MRLTPVLDTCSVSVEKIVSTFNNGNYEKFFGQEMGGVTFKLQIKVSK